MNLVQVFESVYEKAFQLATSEKGLSVKRQHPITVTFRGNCVGEFYVDLYIEKKIIVELKAVISILPEHRAQISNYLKATGVEVGLLINFGNPKLEYRRFHLKKINLLILQILFIPVKIRRLYVRRRNQTKN